MCVTGTSLTSTLPESISTVIYMTSDVCCANVMVTARDELV